MKACVEGFLRGCRPYLAVDSTFLSGKFRDQLCIACAVDGHNWMYPVAIGVIDSETNIVLAVDISMPWLQKIQQQYCTCSKTIQNYGQEANTLQYQKLTM